MDRTTVTVTARPARRWAWRWWRTSGPEGAGTV